MNWVDIEPSAGRGIGRSANIALLHRAIETAPDSLLLHERLGEALMKVGRFQDAIAAFRRSADAAPDQFRSWGALAQCHVERGRWIRALDLCNQADRHGQTAGVARARGQALEMLGRQDEAIVHLRQAWEGDLKDEHALEALFRCLCRAPDAGLMLDFCETLPATPYFQSRRLAYRAIALSRLGRNDEARSLVDTERHVMTFRFNPPPDYGDVDTFNADLADWLGGNTGAIATPRPDCVIDHGLTHMQSPMMMALRAFFRQSFASYIDQLPPLGLGGLMPLPATGELIDFVVFLRGDGRNGEHVHPNAYVVGVYYVQVPEAVRAASDDRGSLKLGSCEKLTNGHRPAWDVRLVKPEPGALVIFPAHMFHDVVPTLSTQPRIVIGTDVRPPPGRSA